MPPRSCSSCVASHGQHEFQNGLLGRAGLSNRGGEHGNFPTRLYLGSALRAQQLACENKVLVPHRFRGRSREVATGSSQVLNASAKTLSPGMPFSIAMIARRLLL